MPQKSLALTHASPRFMALNSRLLKRRWFTKEVGGGLGESGQYKSLLANFLLDGGTSEGASKAFRWDPYLSACLFIRRG